jgi:hypothetical protein
MRMAFLERRRTRCRCGAAYIKYDFSLFSWFAMVPHGGHILLIYLDFHRSCCYLVRHCCASKKVSPGVPNVTGVPEIH